jgi:hypothetical protein
MRWKIRCPYQVAQVQSIENKRGEPIGSFPALSASIILKPLPSKGFAVFWG